MGTMSTFLEWISSHLGGDPVAGRAAELEAQQAREAELERRQETYFGTSTPVVDPETGQPAQRTIGGTERRQDEGLGWSWLSQAWQRITGETTTIQGRDDTTGRETITTLEDRSTTTVTPGGGASIQQVQGERTEVLDIAGMASTARNSLAERREQRQAQRESIGNQLAQLDEQREAASDEQRAELDRRRAELEARRARLTEEIAGIDRDITALEAEGLDEGRLAQITSAHRLQVRPQYTTTHEQRSTTEASVQRQGLGGTATASHETRSVDGGTTETSRIAATGSVDLMSTSAAAGVSATETSSSGGVTETASMSGSASLQASDGRIRAGVSRDSSFSRADEDGNVSEGASRSQSTSASIIANGEEVGVGYDTSSSSSVTVDGRTVGRTDTTSTSITDHGVSQSRTTDRSISGSRTEDGRTSTWRGGAKTSTNGSFRVDVELVEGSLPPQYRVTLQLSAGAGLTLSGSASRSQREDASRGRQAASGSASVSGGASGSVQLTYEHLMSEAEARQYMAEADAADQGSARNARPEFGLISRLQALANEGDDAAIGGAAVLGSSTAAATLDAGESIELSLTGQISGSASASGSYGAFGGGVEAEGSMSTTRRIRVTSVTDDQGRRLVDVTVTFVDASSHTLGANATVEGVTVGARGTGSESQTREATVRLDPSAATYADQYHAVCAALRIEDVQALATRFREAHSETSGGSVSAGALGVTFTGGSQQTMSEDVTRGDGELTGTMSGGQTDSVSISAAGTRGIQSSERNTATGTVDSAGLDVTLEQEERESDIGRSLSEGWNSLTEWFSDDENHDEASEILEAAATSPAERLRAQLEETYARLEEYSLSEPDIDVIRGRARNTTLWERCARHHQVLEPWRRLRSALLSPQPDAEWVEIDPTNAEKLALARAIAQFMSSSGSRGMETMINCMRHWGEGASISDLSIGTAEDVAVFREWPNSIVSKRSKLLTARNRIRTADEHLASLVGRPDGLSRGQAWRDDTQAKLDEVRTAVAGCRDFEHPRAKMEMLDEIMRLGRELEAAWQRNEGALAAQIPMSVAPATSSEPMMSSADDLMTHDPSPPPTAAELEDRARVSDLVGVLVGFKQEETALFQRARSMMTVEHGGTIDGTWDYIWNGDEMGGINSMSEVAELHEAWITRIRELRSVYERLGTPQSDWVVSTGPGAPRNPRHEPDGETLYQIYTTSTGSLQSNISIHMRRDIGAQWRQRARSY